MSITMTPMTGADTDELVTFLATNAFPFHVNQMYTKDAAQKIVEAGTYWNDEQQGYWLHSGGERIGTVRLDDLDDDSPMFDLRLAESRRGTGLGVEVVTAVTAHVFRTMPDVVRFEGQTREDNIAMRKTFVRAGFVKEAHYRMGWPADDGYLASVAYAMIRPDWETGATTAIDWDDGVA